MSDEIRDTAEAVKGIVEAVPIYKKLEELDTGLHTVATTIHAALTPFSALVWGFEETKDYLVPALEKRLEKISQENIQTPDPSVAGPAFDAFRYSGHKEELRELFANLIATAMDKTTAQKAHPSFVEIIKQMNPDEARLFKGIGSNVLPTITVKGIVGDNGAYFKALENFSPSFEDFGLNTPEFVPSYLNNLTRLGLIVESDAPVADPLSYMHLRNHRTVQDSIVRAEESGALHCECEEGAFLPTAFGTQFYDACIFK